MTRPPHLASPESPTAEVASSATPSPSLDALVRDTILKVAFLYKAHESGFSDREAVAFLSAAVRYAVAYPSKLTDLEKDAMAVALAEVDTWFWLEEAITWGLLGDPGELSDDHGLEGDHWHAKFVQWATTSLPVDKIALASTEGSEVAATVPMTDEEMTPSTGKSESPTGASE